jgi:glycosyltransferase involved in cell wall biosynthesis
MNRHERIAVIVPARDEAETIAEVIRRVPYGGRSVTVVDNGSTDATALLAFNAGARVVRVSRPGYGRACLAGIAANPDADVFVFLDADLSENPEDMPLLVNPILRGEADFVLGARGGRGRPWHARLGTNACVSMINRSWGTRYSDLGPFRAIRAASLRTLDMGDQTWGWTIEMQVKASERKLRWQEVVVASGRRAAGRSKISGSLVGSARAGGRMLETITRLRLSARSRTTFTACCP